MSDYSKWNIKDLLEAQLKITVEIQSRVETLLAFESHFLTHAYSANKYEEHVSEIIDLVRKGTVEDEI